MYFIMQNSRSLKEAFDSPTAEVEDGSSASLCEIIQILRCAFHVSYC